MRKYADVDLRRRFLAGTTVQMARFRGNVVQQFEKLKRTDQEAIIEFLKSQFFGGLGGLTSVSFEVLVARAAV